MRVHILIIASLLVGAPAAVASHYDPDNSVGIPHTTESTAWNLVPIIDLTVEWVGVGGEGGEIHRTGNDGFDELDTLGTNQGPDDCADLDELDASPYAYLYPWPTAALRPPADEAQLTEEQSVAADASLVDVCNQVRQLAWAQDENYQYASGEQRVGVGRTGYAFDWVYAIHGEFNSAFHANVAAFEAVTCPVTGPLFTAGTSFFYVPNGHVSGALDPTDCEDQTVHYTNTIADRGAAWDAGTINLFSGILGTAYLMNGGTRNPAEDYSAEHLAPGLYVFCYQATMTDHANDLTWGFEDYTWVWHDEAPFLLAPNWLDINSWDGLDGESHCSEVNPAFPV